MGIPSRALGDGSIQLVNLSDPLRKHAAVIDRWTAHQPAPFTIDANGVAALYTAAVTQVDQFLSPSGVPWHMYQTTEQTLAPRQHADGLIISGDLVNNETLEYVPGLNNSKNPFGCTVGTSPRMLFSANIKIADVSGSDQTLIGWRKQEAFAVPTSFLTTGDGTYTDFYGVGFASAAANPNNVYVAYDLNNSGSTTVADTLFNWADGKTHNIEVEVLPSGKVIVRINGVELGGTVSKDGLGAALTAQSTLNPTPAFTFDAGDFLVPFIFIRHDAAAPGAYNLYETKHGPATQFRLT